MEEGLILPAVEVVDTVERTDTRKKRANLTDLVYLGGLGADSVTTAYSLSTDRTRELNPLTRWAGTTWAAPVGAAQGLVGWWAVNRWVKPRKPKLAKWMLLGYGVAHGLAAVYNIRVVQTLQPLPVYVLPPPTTWIDEAFFAGLK